MKSKLRLILVLMFVFAVGSAFGQDSATYSKTRELLLKMDRTKSDKTMKKLFEEGIERKSDLIRAIDDKEQRVSVNAQVIINYLSDAEMLAAISRSREQRALAKAEFWAPKMTLETETKILNDLGADLTEMILKNLYPKDCHARLIGFNKDNQTALIEVIEGSVFTTGYHVSIRKEGKGWRLLSNNLVWNG